MSEQTLLIELGTEELPPKALQTLSSAFSREIRTGLKEAGLETGEFHDYCSPRRLAVQIENVAAQQPDRSVERKGPALAAAFDADGNATKAAEGFARSCGVTVADLEQNETDKGSWLMFRVEQKGAALDDLVPDIINTALSRLPIPKRMRWGDSDYEFVRPVHWLVVLHGSTVIEASALGVASGNRTRGHRFHHPDELEVANADSYAALLSSQAYVLPDFAERRDRIRAQVDTEAAACGGKVLMNEALLDEVTALVEWPVALSGSFDAEFLEIPQEALITTMQDNQKYFAVVDAEGNLLPNFITISNIESKDPSVVISGNERVIRPRFADAAFFWNVDRKNTLETRIESLKSIVFQQKLGTLHDKTLRVEKLAAIIATAIGSEPKLAARAAMLSKCDLMTDMVGEFASMQGVAGRYFALHDGEDPKVAHALEQQYWPKQAGGQLPEDGVARSLALADKLDTLVGIFGIGQKPTGAKDPFALRRASLGILRIMIECELDLDLKSLIQAAAEGLGERVEIDDVIGECFAYVSERMKAYYQDQGISLDVIDAVLSQQPERPLDANHRVRAVHEFKALPEAESLAAANKRIRNILKKNEGAVPAEVNAELLQDDAEKTLHTTLETMRTEVNGLFDGGNYQAALTRLAALRDPVDRFFDDVMVMADDEALRNNRLALLNSMESLFMRAADLSRLQ